MAPHQEEYWDENDIGIVGPAEISIVSTTKNDSSTTHTMDDSCNLPMSILRKPKLALSNFNVGITNSISSWSSSNRVVRFSSPLITSIHKRTRTHILDVPKLYYSPSDIKQFKREYRQLVRAQELTRERMLENSRRTVVEEKNNGDSEGRRMSSKDDSYIGISPACDEKNKGSRSNDDISFQKKSKQSSSCGEDDGWDPLNDGSSSVTSSSQDAPFSSNPSPPPTTTTGGIFSSVYDVASSLFNVGTPSSYYSSSPSYESTYTTESSSTYSEQCSSQRRRPRRRLSNTSMHLVDTLYLF